MGDQDLASVGRRFSQPQAINRQELARRQELPQVNGAWNYLYLGVDRDGQTARRPDGQTVDFVLTGKRDLATVRRFFERAIDQHDMPKSFTINKSGANAAAVVIVHRRTAAPPHLRRQAWCSKLSRATSRPPPTPSSVAYRHSASQ